MSRQAGLELFVLSFLSLFIELAVIRWLSSYVVWLGFFSNLVLIAAFLGLSLGILAASRRFNLLELAPGALSLTVLLGVGVYWAYLRLPVGVKVQTLEAPTNVFLGSEARALRARFTLVPIEPLAAIFFLLTVVLFLGIGQELGRRFELAKNPLHAYLLNLLASVLGVASFTAMSWAGLSPMWWLAAPALMLLPFLRGSRLRRALQTSCLVGAMVGVSAIGLGVGFDLSDIHWSPYYHLQYDRDSHIIYANGLGCQRMFKPAELEPFYRVPYALAAEVGMAPRRLLVIGAGSGNDLSQALHSGVVDSIDAVEIDPVVAELGRALHVMKPYDDPRVHLTIDDGRAFLRKPGAQYDLIVFALIDSLAAHSSYSSIRLESYLQTLASYEDVRQKLAPSGLFVIYQAFQQGFVVQRMAAGLETAFGEAPLILSIPAMDVVDERSSGTGTIIYVSGNLAPIRKRFAEQGKLCLEPPNEHSEAAPRHWGGDCVDGTPIWPARLTASTDMQPASDDWPFLYLREKRVPRQVLIMDAAIILVSLVLLALLMPSRTDRFPSRLPSTHFLFLGAGFMALETRSVVQLALLYGATWLTTAVVILAILVMSSLATLLVHTTNFRRQGIPYVLLAISLLVNYFVAATSLVGLAEPLRSAAVFVLVGSPIFFAGIIFGVSFAASKSPARDFGSNIAGIVLGAVTENMSVLIGFRALLLVALAFYALSALARFLPGGDREIPPATA